MKAIWYRNRFKREYRWRVVGGNNRKMANGGEGYGNKADMVAAYNSVVRPEIEVEDRT